jgi:hypothetical protein
MRFAGEVLLSMMITLVYVLDLPLRILVVRLCGKKIRCVMVQVGSISPSELLHTPKSRLGLRAVGIGFIKLFQVRRTHSSSLGLALHWRGFGVIGVETNMFH